MDNYRVSKNYAKSLFQLAVETDTLAAVADDMHLVNETFKANHELYVIYNNPMIPQAKKLAIVRELFDSRVSRLTSLFLAFVVKKKRVVNLRGISAMFLEMYRESRGVVLAEMSTSYAVDPEVTAMVAELVGHVTGKDVEVNATVDDKIIGGFVVKFNNRMFDTRIRTQIANLRKQFAENEYESKL